MRFLQIFCIVLAAVSSQARIVNKSEVKQLTDEYFDFRLQENPKFAEDYGIPKYQGKVQEWNRAAFSRRIRKSEDFQRRVDDLLKEDKFENKEDKLGLRIIAFGIRKYLEGAPYMNLTVTMNGDLANIKNSISLFKPVDTMEKLRFWYDKVVAYKQVFEDQKVLMDEGIASKLLPLRLNAVDNLKKYRSAIGNSEADFFALKPWNDLNVTNANRTFYDEGVKACKELRDVMIEFANKFENDYIPVCRSNEKSSVSNLDGGAEWYKVALKYFTSDETTPEKAYNLGLQEVARITSEMRKIVKAEGFNGTVREFVDKLEKDPNEKFSTREAVKAGFEDMLNNKIRPQLSKEFSPESNIGLSLLDDPYGSIGRYQEPRKKPDGTYTNGTFVYDGTLDSWLKITMLPTIIHESVPGHHYQATYVISRTKLPDYRRYVEYSHYAQGGFNYPFYAVYTEGWALYVEYLSESMGIVKTNKEKLGKLSQESLRAARLVVDTGLSYYNWTMAQAAEYLVNNTILTNSTSWGQVIRYVNWPGQACSYKIGELKLKEIRNKAKKELGNKFDPKTFHDAILSLGPCPMSILEEQMNEWIEDNKEKKDKKDKNDVRASAGSSSISLFALAFTLIFPLLMKC